MKGLGGRVSVPESIVRNRDLSLLEAFLYGLISGLAVKNGYCYAKNSYFAEYFGRTERQIRKAIENLSKAGLISVILEKGNERKIFIPPTCAEENFQAVSESENDVQEEEKFLAEENFQQGGKKTPPLVDTTPKVSNTKNNINNNINIYKAVLQKLNEVCKTHFRDSTKAKKHVLARIREGYTLKDFETVIRAKYEHWGSDPVMCRYLRPETLFGSKFAGYLEEAGLVNNANSRRGEPPNGQKQATRRAHSAMPPQEAARNAEEAPDDVVDERMRFMFGGTENE